MGAAPWVVRSQRLRVLDGLVLLALLLCRRGRAGECKGQRQLLNRQPGYVTDGPGNYSVSGNCEWLIRAPNSSFRIVLTFMFLDTECTYDYLFIYDGQSYSSPLLASLSGSTLPESIEAQSGQMLLHLFSDANYNLLGFNATYTFTLCPMGCSGHGRCDLAGICTCHSGWSGDACATQDCGDYCVSHGQCVATQHCQCQPGFIGHTCDLSLNDNQSAGSWYNVSRSDPEFVGRTAAAGTFLNTTNSLYIFGGFDLNEVLGDLVRYNFTSNQWHRIVLTPSPPARHSHSAVEWKGGMLLFGGELADGSLANDVWQYEPVPGSWRLLSTVNSQSPPGLAAHAAAVVDKYLYVCGGRTGFDRFNARMLRFHLETRIWEEVVPTGGRSPAVAGHSMVFHPASRMLLVHGGHRVSPRFSYRTNTTDAFHVDLRYWTTFKSHPSPSSPRERAFHSATVIGNYMVVYGGNVHIHYQEEKCYDGDIFFYHLGCHQWVSSEELGLLINTGDGRESKSFRGRYSHVAAVMNGNILLVAGGYSGRPMGDLVAYKVPIFVSQVVAQNVHLDYCSLYGVEEACSKDPECVWCPARCQSYQPHSTCPHVGCLGLARLLPDCQSCLVFGQSRVSPPQAAGLLGWCVQTGVCLSNAEDPVKCQVEPVAGIYGWWGSETTFITSLGQCQSLNFMPGLHLVTYMQPRNNSQPDKVEINTSPSYIQNPSTELDVVMVYQGFIHPLFDSPAPSDNVVVKVQLQRLYVVAKISRTANSLEMEEVGHWAGQPEKETRLLQRNSGDRLFPTLERGNKYTIRLEGSLNNTGNGQTSEMTLTWERPNLVDPSEISFHFLEPFRSEDCDSYRSCLACLADQGCGWCANASTCHQRASGMDSQCGRGLHLVLSPGNCVLCSEHTDCHLCSMDPYCEWQINVNKKGDFQCNRRGRSSSGIRSPASCSKPCHQQSTCQECLNNSSQCAWCQSTHTCFLFTSYLAKYPSGECRDWYDSIHSVSQCMDCSRFLTCKDCLQNFECGWCGNSDNPTIGRCLAGDFSTLRGFASCSAALVGLYNLSLSEPASWSYGVCPDIDECRLQMDNCHPFATCENTFESFKCHCDRGYAGDGSSYCSKTCYNDCTHGWCSGPPDYSCTCDLGWTSDALSFNQTGVECDVDCGCNFHSTCLTGIGNCDRCQDWTMGEQCELCRPGSHGNATGRDGCRQCACNGHGVSALGDCDGTTGNCYCTEHTEGTHCQRCVAGYYGDPRDNGTCYRECVGRILLKNISSSALGSMRGNGISPSGLAYCLWVLSTSDSLESCQAKSTCPVVSLTIRPDIRMKCGQNYVYVFDGIPENLTVSAPDSAIYSDPSLIGVFCGKGRDKPITVEAVSGLLTVYFEANISGAAGLPAEGFNATYAVNDCQPTCRAGQLCQKGHCVCSPGSTGSDCASQLCPNNCSLHTQAGFCDSATGLCVCADGFAGRDCGTRSHSGTIIWDTVTDTELFTGGGGPLLRLGHSMVEGPNSTLWIFGGLSVRDGILSSVYNYSVPDRRWSQDVRTGGLGPSARYFHAAASIPSRVTMYVVGGLTVSGVVSDFWLLNLATLEWRSEKSEIVPPVAGHTLTQCRNSSLLLVGGYSPQNGFNNKLLEYSVASGKWSIGQHTGTAPTGLYGHSAIYHQTTDALYVFGGYRFYLETVSASRELYSLYLPTLTWSLLAPSHGTKPMSRFFHVAGLFRDTMVLAGGRTESEDFSANIVFYQINCNTWIKPNNTGSSMLGEPMKESIAHAGVTLRNKLYISAGYGGVTLGSMVALSIPLDPCLVLTSPGACNSSSCVWCRSVHNGSCLSADEAERYGFESGSSLCDPLPKFSEDCRRLKTCSECLARHPKVMGQMQRLRCKWCTNCPEGACISTNASCTKENDCRINQREIFVANNCSEISCEASDCSKCTASGKCMWTRQFKRTGETRRILSVSPAYDWTCFSHSLRNVSPMPVESCPPEPCPAPCHNLTTCGECLSSNGSDGGWQQCVWSLALQQCMSPSFLAMRCAAGMCGRLLKGLKGSCNLSCASYNQCSRCIRHSHCGWCSTRGLNGIGKCVQGGLSGPQNDGTYTCRDSDGSWAFMSCPPENECLNGHHDCDETQNCTDKLHGFECVCRNGYMQDNVAGLCKPVCEQGCVNGTCVEPNSCRCHFGYVGQNCSVECQCNQHSNCESVGARDHCLQCVNNTKGDHCEKCKPLFVGSALAGGLCEPCSNYCNNNSHICIMREQYEKGRMDPERYPLNPAKITNWVLEGPVEESAVCVQCLNNSSGERCDTCLDGYFLLEGKCTKCQCNGHWDRCRSTDGTECQCQNNTETSCPTAQTDKKDCYKYQCARCKENFLGNPTNGRQCYRQITVEQEYCFDPTSQSNCYHEPNIKNLPLGRTVLFAVQPKFTNVDIRITIDVTFGGVDVYISNSHSSFTVSVSPASGVHAVQVGDPDSRREPPSPELLRRRRALNVSVPLPEAQDAERVREERAEGLTTYITISTQHTILIVRGVRERLVITYPYVLHTLKTQRFFMVLLGVGNRSGGGGESQGLLFFRQDQAHIDLFVFFSVFFSCFFLFLSVCVLLWKMKQFVDFRREHRRHIQEMNKMASRPFAKLAVYFEPDAELVFLPLRHKLMPRLKPEPHVRRSEPFLPQLIGYSYTSFRVGPITLEPTDDGMAGVATVMFQLPGGILAPNRACLGSALVTLRHNLQEYCSSGHGASSARKGGLSHDNLTSMSM